MFWCITVTTQAEQMIMKRVPLLFLPHFFILHNTISIKQQIGLLDARINLFKHRASLVFSGTYTKNIKHMLVKYLNPENLSTDVPVWCR